MFGRIFCLDGRESYRELRLEPLSSGPVAAHPMRLGVEPVHVQLASYGGQRRRIPLDSVAVFAL